MKKKILIFLVILSLVFGLLILKYKEDNKNAEKFMQNYLDILENRNFKELNKFLSVEFLNNIPEKDYLKVLEAISQKFGDITNYELKNYRVVKQYSKTDDYDKYYILNYRLNCTKGIQSQTFKIIENNNGQFKIFGHQFDSISDEFISKVMSNNKSGN